MAVHFKERLSLASFFFTLGAVFASWAGRIPEIKSHLSLSDGQLGFSMFCLAIGSLISMPVSGALGSRVATERLTTYFSCAFAVSLIFIALAPNWLLFSLALFAFGFMMGGQDVSMNAHAVHVERDHGTHIMSPLHGTFSLGAIAGGALSSVMCRLALSPLVHFCVVAAVLIPSALAVSRVLLPRAVQTAEDATPIFVLPDRRLLMLAMVAFCSFIGEGAISDWSGVYLASDLQSGPTLAASGFAIFSLSMAACRFAGDRILERIGPTRILLFGGLIAASGIAMSLLTHSATFALVSYLVAGIGFSCMVPVAFSSAGRNQFLPPSVAIAGVATAGYFGFVIAPAIIGFLADRVTLRVALWLTVVLSLCVSAMAPFAVKQPSATDET